MAKGADRSSADKARAKYLKDNGVERLGGRCAVCYRFIPNDTFGGAGARNHYPALCVNARTGKAARMTRFAMLLLSLSFASVACGENFVSSPTDTPTSYPLPVTSFCQALTPDHRGIDQSGPYLQPIMREAGTLVVEFKKSDGSWDHYRTLEPAETGTIKVLVEELLTYRYKVQIPSCQDSEWSDEIYVYFNDTTDDTTSAVGCLASSDILFLPGMKLSFNVAKAAGETLSLIMGDDTHGPNDPAKGQDERASVRVRGSGAWRQLNPTVDIPDNFKSQTTHYVLAEAITQVELTSLSGSIRSVCIR